MARPEFAEIPAYEVERYRDLLGEDYPRVAAAAERARGVFAGRTVWNVNSTLHGGGVAEMLRALLPYVRGAGVDSQWVVLREQPEFFELTKRLHNNLHGDSGDGGDLGESERELYESALMDSSRHLAPMLKEDDVVLFHDPQTAGLIPAAKETGARIIWRCHIGADDPDESTRRAWDFLAPYVTAADAYVFSRRSYVWDLLDPDRAAVMAPSIDPLSPKNQELDDATVDGIIGAIGLGEDGITQEHAFARADGTPASVERRAQVVQDEPLPDRARVVAQISRWDRLKDHPGLLRCFERYLGDEDLHLVLVGPATAAVSDDPEGAGVWREVENAWYDLAPDVRRRAHLVSLPMDDTDENAAMVNAIQRRAEIVVQKSIAEGFGLTVAEAMWKRRPVIGTRVGGIQDQIVDGESGLLIDDPRDLEALAKAIRFLANDRERAGELAAAGRERVREMYLSPIRLAEYVDLLSSIEPGGER